MDDAKSRSNTRVAINTLSNLINARNNYTKSQMDFKKEVLLQKIKSKIERENKQAMFPMELEQERQKKQIMNLLETEQLNQYKANPGGFSAPGKPITPDQRLSQIIMKNQGIPEDQWPVQDKLFIQQYQRIYGKVFQPKGANEDMSWMGGQSTPKTTPATVTQPSGRIRVKTKDGQTGTIEAGEFDPSMYEKI